MLFSRTAQQAPHDLRYPLSAVHVANRDQVSPPARLSTIVKLEFCGGANGNKGSNGHHEHLVRHNWAPLS